MRTALLVLANAMFAGIIGFYGRAAIKLWKTNRSAAIAAVAGAAHWVVIWAIAGLAVVLEDIKSSVLWLVLAVVISTLMRIWAVLRYRKRSAVS